MGLLTMAKLTEILKNLEVGKITAEQAERKIRRSPFKMAKWYYDKTSPKTDFIDLPPEQQRTMMSVFSDFFDEL